MNHALIVASGARMLARHHRARIERLIREGFTVHVAAGDDGGFELLPAEAFARPLPSNIAALPAAFVLLQAYIIEHEPLLVHGFGTTWATVASLAAHRVDTPAIFSTIEHHLHGADAEWPHLMNLLRGLGAPLDDVSQGIYRRVAEWSDRYITTTVEDMQIAESWTPGQKLDLAVGGRGANVSELNPHASDLPSVESVREALLPQSRRNWVGAIVDEEGVDGLDELARVARALELARPDTTFVLGVDPLSGPATIEAARATNAPWSVRHVEEPLSFMRALDLFLMMPKADPYGSGAMTASACGTPVAAVDFRHGREVVVDQETGIVVDQQEFVEAVGGLLDDPGLRRRMGVRARSRAVERFDRRQVDDQLLRLYDNVLRGKLA